MDVADMTDQQVFNRIAAHLLVQRKRSMKDDLSWRVLFSGNGCAYRGDDGLSCAVGCLIPDELYDRSIEDLTITSGAMRAHKVGKYLGLQDEDRARLLRDLQRIHDEVLPCNWANALFKLAGRLGLDTTVVTHFDPNL